MKKSVLLLACLFPFLASCSQSAYFDHLEKGEPFVTTTQEAEQSQGSSDTSQAPIFDSGLPPQEGAVLPPRDSQDTCPYLPDTQWVSDTTGQRTLGQGLDTRFDTPACVFWSYNEAPSLQVIVRHFPDEETAREAVNFYAPIETTSPASVPLGWDGGRGSFPGMAVYAVQKGNMVVISISNQEQTIKVQAVTEEVIKNLGL